MANKVATLRIESIIGRKDGMAEMFGEQPNFAATDLSKFLADNKKANTLEIIIRTDGGNVDEAYDMVTQLKEWKAQGKKIITKGYQVNSAGTLLFIQGDERLVSDFAPFTIHNSRTSVEGAPKEILRAIADELEVYDNKLLSSYVEALSLTEHEKAQVKELMTAETNLTADQVIKYGFATGKIVEASNVIPYFWTNKIAALVNKSNTNNSTMEKDVKKIQAEVTGLKSWFVAQMKKLKINAEVVAATSNLEDGTPIYYDGELVEGTLCFTDTEMTVPCEDGEYVLEDGRTITIIDGAASTIQEAVTDAKDKQIADLTAKVTALETEKADLVKSDKENKKVITDVMAKIETIEKTFTTGTGKAAKTATTGTQTTTKSVGKEEVSKFASLRAKLN